MSVVINGSAGVTTNSGAVYNGISAGTAVASTSGTSIDFTSIPSWVKRITVIFNGVSTSGANDILVQIGAGSITTTGYSSGSGRASGTTGAGSTSTAGFNVYDNAASNIYSGSMVLLAFGANAWVSSHSIGMASAGGLVSGGGSITLGGNLDRIRITTTTGTDTFDAGSINILYE